jgi:hypothetical protein
VEKHKRELAFLRKKAFKISEKYAVDYEEIKSELYEAFCEALYNFDESQSKFITYLYSKVNTVEERIRGRKFNLLKSKYDHIEFNESLVFCEKYFKVFCKKLYFKKK